MKYGLETPNKKDGMFARYLQKNQIKQVWLFDSIIIVIASPVFVVSSWS